MTCRKTSRQRASRPWGRLAVLLGAMLLAAMLGAPLSAWAKVASMVVDAETGEVLHASNVDSRNYPASLTKMMTLYLLFDDLESGKVHLGDRLLMSKHAASMAPTKLGVKAGKTLTVEDAMLGMITRSANDAAAAMGEYLGGSEDAFALRMTRKAHELGMSQTTFKNASGLPNPDQKSTARDMATLARALLHNHGKQYHYFATREFTFNGTVVRGHNHLLDWYDGADGIKTGYVDASGFNLVASAKRDGRRLIGVVFGGDSAASRDRQMAKLLDAGFSRAPGSSGVLLSEFPEQREEDDMPSRTKAVMKAMSVSRQQAQARMAAAHHDQGSGDADDEDWGIQVGSYAQSSKALQIAQTTKGTLGKLASDGEAQASPQRNGRHAVYRARIVGLSEDDARRACQALSKRHRPCRPVNLG